MAVIVSPTTCTLRVKLNAGTAASGAPLLKNMSLFTSGKLKASLDNSGLEAGADVADLLASCLVYPMNSIEYVATSSVAIDE